MIINVDWKKDGSAVFIYGLDDMRISHSGYFKVFGFE